MIELNEHWEFITAAYLGTVIVVGGLIGWTVLAARSAKRRVQALEAARKSA